MTQHYLAHDEKGFQAWRIVNGRYRLAVGPHFPTPRAAMAYADALDAASEVSPLPTPRRADEPDLAGGFWGAAESRDADRQPAGSPVAHSPLPGAG